MGINSKPKKEVNHDEIRRFIESIGGLDAALAWAKDEKRREVELVQQRMTERKFGRDIQKRNLHLLAERCANGETVSILPPLKLTTVQPVNTDLHREIYRLAGEFLICADIPSDEKAWNIHENIREMYEGMAAGEFSPALGASATRNSITIQLDLSPFMTRQQVVTRLSDFNEKAVAITETVRQRFVFGQRFVCAAGWLMALKHKDGKNIELQRYRKLLAVAQAERVSGPTSKLESVALALGWGTKYPDSKLAELSRDIDDARELVRRAALGTFPFNEWGELTLPSAEKKKIERSKNTTKSRR